jgi:hypothetical protein
MSLALSHQVGGDYAKDIATVDEDKPAGLFSCVCNQERRRQRILNQKLWVAAREGDTQLCLVSGSPMDNMHTEPEV